MVSKRNVSCSCVIGNFLYIYGGYGGQNPKGLHQGDFYRFNFLTQRWQRLEVEEHNSPGRRHSAAGFVYQDAFYILGGANEDLEFRADLWRYEPATSVWELLSYVGEATPSPRWGHAVAVEGDQLFLAGGFEVTGICSDFWVLNLTTRTWRELKPQGAPLPRAHYMKMLSHKERLWLFGGFDGSRNLTEVYCYNPVTNHLSLVSKDMPGVRGFGLVLYKDHAYIFGGFSRTSRLTNLMFEYSFETNTFSEVLAHGEMIQPRSFPDCQLYGDRMYVFGGIGPKNLDDFYFFSFDGLQVNTPDPDTLAQLFDRPMFSDITLVVGKQTFHAHRCVLYARSSHFRALLSSGMRDSRTPEIVIEDASPDVFRLLLQFLYTGHCPIRSELKKDCEHMLVKGLTPANVCEVAEFASRYHADELLTVSFDFIKAKCVDEQLLSKELQVRYAEHVKAKADGKDDPRLNFVRLPDSARRPRRPAPANAADADAQAGANAAQGRAWWQPAYDAVDHAYHYVNERPVLLLVPMVAHLSFVLFGFVRSRINS